MNGYQFALLAAPAPASGNGDSGPAWAVALFVIAWVILAGTITYGLIRKHRRRREAKPFLGSADGEQSPVAPHMRLPKPLAFAYLAVVALVWIGHLVGLALLLATGRASWTTERAQVVVPLLAAVAVGVVIVWLVKDKLRQAGQEDHPLRLLALTYGAAVGTAWRRLRS